MSQQRYTNMNRREGNITPKGALAMTINLNDIKSDSDSKIKIEGYKFLASYNWTKADEPTIFVPGIQHSVTIGTRVTTDNGQVLQHSGRLLHFQSSSLKTMAKPV